MDCNCTVTSPGPSLARCGGTTVSLFMLVLEQFLRTQCDIEDPCGQINPRTEPLPEYDFIVVGSGSAGAVVASRLSEISEWKVLLVEAGPNEPTASQVPSFSFNAINSFVDWKYVTEPESTAFLNNGGRTTWPRGKVIGGTSVLNGMKYVRGNRNDFDNWEKMGNTGWSYKDVLPYFIKSENNLHIELMDKGYHGVGGYLPVSRFSYLYPFEEDLLKGAREMGLETKDHNGENQTGFGVAQTTSKNGVRYSTSRSFLRPIQNRKNLHIMLNTYVTRVLVDNNTKQVLGVEIIQEDKSKRTILAAKEVVICGGAIGSPQILLQSGVGDETLLSSVGIPTIQHLPGVGRNLHDHISFRVKFNSNQSNFNDLNWAVAMQYMLFRDGPMTTNNGLSIIGFLQSNYVNKNENHPDIRMEFAGYLARCSQTGATNESNPTLSAYTSDNEDMLNSTTRVISMIVTLLRPKSSGYLTLKDNTFESYPKIYPGYLSNPADIPPIIDGIKYAIRLSETKALTKYGIELDKTLVEGCEGYTFGDDNYWECAIRRDTSGDSHQAGSCKMGPDSDPDAVVDPQLRVRGVQGLRVADASIMPNVTSGNTHAPTIMIGEKASEMIKQTWSS